MDIAMALLGKEEVKRQMRAAMERSIQSVGDAVELNTRLVLVRAEDRLYAPRTLNIQDYATGQKFSRRAARREAFNATVSQDRQEGRIESQRLYLKIRSKAAVDVISRYEGGDSLERTGLWLLESSKYPGRIIHTHGEDGQLKPWARNRTSREGLTFFAFASHSGLNRWAHRADRGSQYLRQSGAVVNAETVMGLVLGAALKESRAEIYRHIQVAAERGFTS